MTIGILADQYFVPTGVRTSTRQLLDAVFAEAPQHDYVLLYPGAVPAAGFPDRPGVTVRPLPDRRWLYPLWHAVGAPSLDRWAGDLDVIHVPVGSVRVPTTVPTDVTIGRR